MARMEFMNQKVTAFFLCLFSSGSLGGDIAFIHQRIDCLSITSNEKYEYRITATLKNTTNHRVTLQTDSLTTSIDSVSGRPDAFHLGGTMDHKVLGVSVVPSAVDFRLVELGPGEAAQVGFIKESRVAVPRAKIVYSIGDLYSDRFGFWAGTAESEYVDVNLFRNCEFPPSQN